jgi:hypothetical protein
VHLLLIIGSHGADGLRLLGGELAHCCGHVLGDIHQHRALAAALRNAESCPHGIGQVLYPAHREVMLCDGHRNALDVRFLKAVPANAAGGHVAGKGHHGHRVHIGGGNAGDQIGGTRAAGSQHHAGAAGGAGVAVRCMGCALLVGGKHMGDAVGILIQLVVKVQHSAAGVAKKSVHSLLAQDLYKDLRTIQLHGVAPIPVPLLIHSLRESFRKRKSPCPLLSSRDKDLVTSSSLRYHSRWRAVHTLSRASNKALHGNGCNRRCLQGFAPVGQAAPG